MLARQKWQVRTINVLDRVFEERLRQVDRYGQNDDLEDGTGPDAEWVQPIVDVAQSSYSGRLAAKEVQQVFRDDYEEYERIYNKPTWMHLIREEVAEAFEQNDPTRLAEELIQVAALCTSWVEKLEARAA